MLLDTEWWTYNVCPGSITSWHYQASVETFINPGLSLKNIIELLTDSEWWSHESFLYHIPTKISHTGYNYCKEHSPWLLGGQLPKVFFATFHPEVRGMASGCHTVPKFADISRPPVLPELLPPLSGHLPVSLQLILELPLPLSIPLFCCRTPTLIFWNPKFHPQTKSSIPGGNMVPMWSPLSI